MGNSSQHDAWRTGQNYEHYMGRWSREIARAFIGWLRPAQGLDWLDIGCGTGALSATILAHGAPRSMLGLDPSEGFVAHAGQTISDDRARFRVGSAEALPCDDHTIDVVSSALVYNFIPDRPGALAEMVRVAKRGCVVSFYVWDYPGGGMGFIDAFWKAAVAEDADAEALVEGTRAFRSARERP